jgi:hypothetical protein
MRWWPAALSVALIALSSACSTGPSALCEELDDHPEGLDHIDWENGDTSSGGSWSQALADGVLYADDESRAEVAAAVAGDRQGFEDLLFQVDEADRWAYAELHELAVDPAAGRRAADDPRTLEAARVIWATVVQECGWAP